MKGAITCGYIKGFTIPNTPKTQRPNLGGANAPTRMEGRARAAL